MLTLKESTQPHKDRGLVSPVFGLQCWSFSARDNVPVSVREKMDLNREERKELLSSWIENAAQSQEASLFYVSTCHRVELYAYEVDKAAIENQWSQHCAPFFNAVKHYSGEQALRHMIRVSSSLDSEVLGETQVSGQMKKAAQHCKDFEVLLGPLLRFVEWSQRLSKKIRRESQLGVGVLSVAHVAVDGLFDVFESLEDKKTLLVGAGPMALQALERLKSYQVTQITWLNRSVDKLSAYPESLNCKCASLNELGALAWQHDVLVLATAAPKPLLDRCVLKTCRPCPLLSPAPQSPRVILDLGHPRNVEQDIHAWEGFYLRNVDEFRDRAGKALEQRKKSAQLAAKILDEELSKCLKSAETWRKGPLIAELSQSISQLLEDEREHLKLENSSEIGYYTRSVHGKILHRLLKTAQIIEEESGEDVLQDFVKAWRQVQQWPQRKQQAELEGKKPPQQKRPSLQKQA